MFSALKKLVGSDQAPGREKPIPAGLQSMNQALQRRFAKGVQYNMKIVIRGDRNTGKTTLWHRLQGKKFIEEYIPTQEIQVTSIHWNYKTTDDIVKVEVWDVVDKGQKIHLRDSLGKCKKRGDGLKLENDPQETESEMALDAEFLDVYKNCNGVVMMFDITKQWTFNYILRELPKVPNHVPVCVLGNYRDMGEHRVILPDDVREFIDKMNRPPGSSYFRYAESSMKNSFGLKYLHKFFNIPFLQLQRETLLRQLETNQLDIDATLEELSVQQETEDQNYEIFLEAMEARSRGHASPPPTTNGQSPSSGSQSPVVLAGNTSESSSPSTPQPPLPLPQQSPAAVALSPEPLMPQPPVLLPESQLPTAAVAPPPPVAAPQQRRSIISRLFGTSPASEVAPAAPDPATATPPVEASLKVQSVEDFVPEDSLDRSFLDDPAPQRDKGRLAAKAPPDSDRSSKMSSKLVRLGVSTKPNTPKAPAGFSAQVGLEQNGSGSGSSSSKVSMAAVAPEAASTAAAPACWPPKAPSRSKASASKEKGEKREESESDPEGPIATQMLSFVMDDPDFESEESDSQRKRADEFPVREDLSDVSDEETPSKAPQPAKPATCSFKLKNDSDLFGLGLEEAGPKDSSEEVTDQEKQSSKEKKKKKKRSSKEEEEKAAAKKKSKPKKSKEKEEGKDEKDRERKKKKKKRSKENNSEIDELEAFLGGGGGPSKPCGGGGDYEEL
ncbi:rab-like protein 6 isoform X4 [Rhineura floridana]|uniref:rab-like protein 6 isoform X4 n=1 Tax=Rhineura floridana TaxID=261503 RepID=UPI002AC82BD6|nr:rab-like protein 6 isoform X4 [Rhineura floridana]